MTGEEGDGLMTQDMGETGLMCRMLEGVDQKSKNN